ncbi:MAG: serine/threonine protein kinase [Chloroflexota bacterium]|nr:serine/threonine protein kinase [Chloroflexota bacterium]
MLALEGRQLGNYDVTRRIRVGGMGAVYEGRQRTAFGRRVAIKVILGNYATDPDMRRRFAREARTVARLHHPHILPLIEFGDEQGLLYLVMPFIEGGTLTGYLRRSLPELREVAAMFTQLLDAVEYAHDAGLVHRDIKSSNVLMEMRRGGAPYVYLGDFGLVRAAQRDASSQVGKPIPLDQVPGTPHYMAPEQTLGIVTPQTDIYALGVLLYQMLVGELPYDDADEVQVIQMHLQAPIPRPSQRDASIPLELDDVVRTAMAKDPAERFHSVADMREAFLAAIEGPVATVPATEDLIYEEPTTFALPESPTTPESFYVAPSRVSPSRPASGRRSVHFRRGAVYNPAAPPEPVPLRVRRRVKKNMATRRKRLTFLVIIGTLVPAVLLILLIMPRFLNVSIFPSGFPIFGTAPMATITVTAQSKTLQDTYLLTASPRVQSSDMATRVLPSHNLQGAASGTNATQTTGTKTLDGARASGALLFSNHSAVPVFIKSQTIFTTNSGVQLLLTRPVMVPPRQDGTNGTIEAPALAITPGATGNIAVGALAQACCGKGIVVSNPAPFAGGVDGRSVHIVAQADLDHVRDLLSPGLQQQVQRQVTGQLNANESLTGQPTYSTQIAASVPVGAQADHVQVTVSITGVAFAYNRDTARHIAAQLLSQQAAQTLGSGYQLRQGTLTVGAPQVTQQGQDGIAYLSVPVHGLWVYGISGQQIARWQQNIKGAPSAAALAYLNSQPGVSAVRIQLPFGTDHLPSSIEQIQVVLTNP